MEKKQTVDLEKRSQYEMLGCYHDTSKLIDVKDISTLKSAPKQVQKVPHFLWQDINFTKGSSFPERTFSVEDVDYLLKTSKKLA